MPLRWAIIGCGDIANKRVAPAMVEDPGSELVAFFSHTPARAEEMKVRFGARRAYSDLDALLADEEVEAVYLASPQQRHCEETIRAARAGKHVLCEKPMAVTLDDCQRMVAACAKAGVALAVAYYRRWYPKARQLKAMLDEGAIGQPVSARVFIAGRYDPAPDDWKHWRVEGAAGGGAMMDVGSHRLDIICYLLGPPRRVAGLSGRLVMSYDAPDTESLLCELDTGAHVLAEAGWSLGVGTDELEIHGTEGSLIATPFDARPEITLRRQDGDEVIAVAPPATNMHLPLVASFAARVSAGQPPEFDGADGLQASRIISAGYRSHQSGSWEEA
jgi:predicted dehydrogenase